MKQIFKLTLAICLAIILACLFIRKSPALAQSTEILVNKISQEDLNGDGKPELTIIDCAFATGHDLIYVVDQGSDMQTSVDWREATDFSNDIWLYDIGGDGSIQLIVVYKVGDGRETASVYDDQNGDRRVKYERTGTQVKITESPYWSAQILSDSTWVLPGGQLNLNLHFEFDGPYPMFAGMPDEIRQSAMKHDGKVDAEYEAVAGNDGIADYVLNRLLASTPSYMNFQRSVIESNEGNYVTKPFKQAYFPFLPVPIVPDETTADNLRAFDLPPFIVIDWVNGKIQGAGLSGTPIGHGQFCHDNYYIEKGIVNDVSFECPLAYYDLNENRDAFPELNIRMFYFTAGDPGLAVPWGYSVDQAVENIYYSWSMASKDTLNWDYKVGLAGNYTIDEVEQFKDFVLRKVPYAEFPGWVTDHNWKLTTFIARENRAYVSSEGIWEWDPLEGVDPILHADLSPEVRSASLKYMIGASATSPEAYFNIITQGFRAERNFAGPAKPWIYISPIDHKLHLFGSQWGIWNIDGKNAIQYFDRNNDGYLDEWQYLKNNVLAQQINSNPDFMVYSGNGETIVKRATLPLSLYESNPPTNHENWSALGQQLDQNLLTAGPEDFKALLAQFEGAEMRISGAILRNYRQTADGFRFMLELNPNFTVSGVDWLGVQGRAAGEYLVTYSDALQLNYLPWVTQSIINPSSGSELKAGSPGGRFELLPLTPPELKISIDPKTPTGEPRTQYVSQELQVTVGNEGLEDANQVLVSLGTSQAGEEIRWTEPQTVTVLAGETTPVSFQWEPEAAGEWKLQIRASMVDLKNADGTAVIAEQMTQVEPAQSTTLQEEISAFNVIDPWQAIVLLASVVVIGGLAGWVLMRSLSEEAHIQAPSPDKMDAGPK